MVSLIGTVLDKMVDEENIPIKIGTVSLSDPNPDLSPFAFACPFRLLASRLYTSRQSVEDLQPAVPATRRLA